ncbi:nickel-dependent hydrogenase large subunit [bacterium]|nr:nickel-dependent hydrogenase large subunit [bacterium]
MPYHFPIGPYNPVLEEPYKLNLSCKGETIEQVDVEVGFTMRGIELLAQRRNYLQVMVLVERVCGICSNTHAMTMAMAMEKLAGVVVPARAQYIRTIMGELERLHSHLLWSGIGSEDIGFTSMFMEIYYLRENIMDILETISGNRVNYGMIEFGGVTRDIPDPSVVLPKVKELRQALEKIAIPIFTHNPTVKSRTIKIGVLSKEDALRYSVVGPMARASGIAMDVRQDMPYAAYEDLNFQIVTSEDCDVQARLVVRALEMLESIRLIEDALENMPAGPIGIGERFPVIPPGEATARSEAPRGECFYYIASDGSDTPVRVKIRTPSYINIPAVKIISTGAHLADMPLIQASIDPCVSCTDR